MSGSSSGVLDAPTQALHRPVISMLATAYPLLGFVTGLGLVAARSLPLNVLGALLIAHTSTWAGLMSHELMHESVFRSRRTNAWLGAAMNVPSGACYFPFPLLRAQHLEHHALHVGVDGFSVNRWFHRRSRPMRALVLALEWLHIPVLTVLINVRARVVPFFTPKDHGLRARIVVVLALRVAVLAGLTLLNPWAPLWYALGHLGMLHVMRLYDCYHHTFDVYPRGARIPKLPKGYLQANTYSSLFNRDGRATWLNALFLNYGYHNAHHARPNVPWYRLPELDRELFGERSTHCILMPDLLVWYHRNRLHRIYRGLGRPVLRDGRLDVSEYWGIIMNITFLSYAP